MIDTKAYLRLDVPTRWKSTYMMLKVAEKYEHAFDSYARDDNSFFLDLTVRDGVPTFDDWGNVQRITIVLKPFYNLTLKVSGSLHVTSHFFWETLIDMHCLLDEWINCEDLEIISMASKMRENYNKYLGDAKNINFIVYLVIILDQRRKMGFENFGVYLLFPNVAREVMKMIDKELYCFFDEYSFIVGKTVSAHESQSSIPTKVFVSMDLHQSKDWLRKYKDPINLDEYVVKLQEMEDDLSRIFDKEEVFSKLPIVHEEEDEI